VRLLANDKCAFSQPKLHPHVFVRRLEPCQCRLAVRGHIQARRPQREGVDDPWYLRESWKSFE
jgi:hypothetical protein